MGAHSAAELLAERLDKSEKRVQFLEARLRAITQWLEANEASVFRRGIWEAVNAVKPEHISATRTETE